MSTEKDLQAFIAGVDGFGEMGHQDKVRLFAWLQHHLFKKDFFGTRDINSCYAELYLQPSNTSQYLKNMEGKEILKDGRGYYCEGQFRRSYDEQYGLHQVTLSVRQLVRDLISGLPELEEKDIFQEAMICLKYDAGRAAIIMVWNIAFY